MAEEGFVAQALASAALAGGLSSVACRPLA